MGVNPVLVDTSEVRSNFKCGEVLMDVGKKWPFLECRNYTFYFPAQGQVRHFVLEGSLRIFFIFYKYSPRFSFPPYKKKKILKKVFS
jgi:hypothetical protein